MFARGSRYENVAQEVYAAPDGRRLPYVLLRAIVDAPVQQEHAVAQRERLDHIAARYFGDPEQFWRICDANRALWPDDLTAIVGRRLRIPLAR
jgi:hypothetical protein